MRTSLPPAISCATIFFMTELCLHGWMDACVPAAAALTAVRHARSAQAARSTDGNAARTSWHVWVRLDGHRSLRVVLDHVLKHLLRRQWLTKLQPTAFVVSVRASVWRARASAHLVVAKQPHARRLVVLVIRDGQVIRACLDNVVVWLRHREERWSQRGLHRACAGA